MKNYRSICPLSRSLDIFGDKWTLLILREISVSKKDTFRGLAQMPERIASNTLADRLEKLTAEGILLKSKSKRNKLVFHYTITEKGLDLMPVMKAIAIWSEKYLYNDEEKLKIAETMNMIKGKTNTPKNYN